MANESRPAVPRNASAPRVQSKRKAVEKAAPVGMTAGTTTNGDAAAEEPDDPAAMPAVTEVAFHPDDDMALFRARWDLAASMTDDELKLQMNSKKRTGEALVARAALEEVKPPRFKAVKNAVDFLNGSDVWALMQSLEGRQRGAEEARKRMERLQGAEARRERWQRRSGFAGGKCALVSRAVFWQRQSFRRRSAHVVCARLPPRVRICTAE